jgi:hypothetical protein
MNRHHCRACRFQDYWLVSRVTFLKCTTDQIIEAFVVFYTIYSQEQTSYHSLIIYSRPQVSIELYSSLDVPAYIIRPL